MATGSVRSKKIEKPVSAKVDVNPKVGHRPAKGHHAAESVYAKGQCKSGVLYKPGSPCGRKLTKEALGQKETLHGEQIQKLLTKGKRLDPEILKALRSLEQHPKLELREKMLKELLRQYPELKRISKEESQFLKELARVQKKEIK